MLVVSLIKMRFVNTKKVGSKTKLNSTRLKRQTSITDGLRMDLLLLGIVMCNIIGQPITVTKIFL